MQEEQNESTRESENEDGRPVFFLLSVGLSAVKAVAVPSFPPFRFVVPSLSHRWIYYLISLLFFFYFLRRILQASFFFLLLTFSCVVDNASTDGTVRYESGQYHIRVRMINCLFLSCSPVNSSLRLISDRDQCSGCGALVSKQHAVLTQNVPFKTKNTRASGRNKFSS